MKKIFSMLLVAAMLVAMLPCFAVGASAEDAVAVVAATAVNPDDPWASAWAGGTSAVGGDLYAQGGTVAKLEYPTVIDRLEIVSGYWGGRAGNGNKLYASVDGETWDELVSAFGIPNKKENTVVTLDVTSEKAYRYVKIVSTPSNSAASWNASAKTFTVYGTSVEPVAIGATAVDSTDFLAPAWAGNGSLCRGSLPAEGSVAVLERPAVLDRLEIYTGSFAARANGSVIWGSVDGETWEEIGQISGLQSGADTHQYETHQFTLSSEKAYRYVKITLEGGWNCAARKLTVYGTEPADVTVKGVNVAFTQTKIDDTAWSVRFISTVDKAEVDANTYSMIGYNIAAYGTNIKLEDGTPTKYWTNLESNVVYTGVYEVQEGSDEPVLVAAPDGSYLHMVTFKDISLTDYEDVTFVITPYAVLSDGETYVYSNAKTIKFVDGVFVAE